MTWKRFYDATRCGGPCQHKTIPAEAPAFEVTVQRQKFLRCPACALKTYGQTPPADLAPLPPRTGIQPTLLARFDKDSLPLDFKQRQSRDPGEDDD